ncbi:ABC transporter permease [Acetobacter persici]|uniref:ABC transporter permease n=1 Tax=Acetobacter persici TaxID=1076596 RepID=UPI001BAA34C9|nr:ABC transporter permease [Acetobacter persici]MBS1017279.1 ABC transporter permease [Acetobacter persici]
MKWLSLFPTLSRDGMGAIVFGLLAFIILVAPWCAPQNPYDLRTLELLDARLSPGITGVGGHFYLLGTDGQGRDMFSAILYGLRLSLLIAVLAAATACVLGSMVGISSAYYGGWREAVLMRLAEMQLSMPSILVALLLVAFIGPGVVNLLLALIMTQWAYYARVARGFALSERNKAYMDAARGLRLPSYRIIAGHILPNCLSPLVIVFTQRLVAAVMLESTLSFLGVGLPITSPSLGLLVSNGMHYIFSGDYWITFFPGFALSGLILLMNAAGDTIQNYVNTRVID